MVHGCKGTVGPQASAGELATEDSALIPWALDPARVIRPPLDSRKQFLRRIFSTSAAPNPSTSVRPIAAGVLVDYTSVTR